MTGLLEKGALLIANPAIYERNFHRTLVLVMEHEAENGAIGVVLNRASETPVGEILPAWGVFASEPGVVFIGGPVQPEAVIAIGATAAEARPGWTPFWGEMATVDLNRDPLDLGVDIAALRVFAGYSGWSAGQLETELERGWWLVTDARREDVFTPDPDGLWRTVLGRQRGQRRWLANFPEEPSLN